MSNHPNQTGKASSMLDRVKARLDKSIGYRADLHLAQMKPINDGACYAMVSFQPSIGEPTRDDIFKLVKATFGGKVLPVMESIKVATKRDALSIILSAHQVTRDITDARDMHTVVAGATYMDAPMRETWEVQTTAEGQQYLQRVSEDNIPQIVEERCRRMATAGLASQRTTLESILQSGAMKIEVQDVVACFHNGEIHKNCIVASVISGETGDFVTVKIPQVGQITVEAESVTDVVHPGKDTTKDRLSDLNKYYRQALPDSQYADELTRETTRG